MDKNTAGELYTGEQKVDRRVRKTKKLIRGAFTALLMEKPLQEIKVREIADRIDINRGTFYQHYRDVYHMMQCLEDEAFDQFYRMLKEQEIKDLETDTFEVLTLIFTYLKENVDLMRALLGPHGDPAFINRLKLLIRERCFRIWMDDYKAADPQLFESFFAFIVSGCIGMIRLWLENGMKEAPEQMAENIKKFLLLGVQALGTGNTE